MRILVFTRTTGYRHDSIEAGVAALTEIAHDQGVRVRATADPDDITTDALTGSAAVVFLNTSGDVLTDAHRVALTAYLAGGGGFVGVHCAAATEPSWPFYGDLVGARFARHPDVQPAAVRVADADHSATAHLPDPWSRVDEWYDFEAPPGGARILLTVDESSYTGGGMGADHPLCWCHEVGGGRAFYTALGHTPESYADPYLRAHLWGGITWAGKGSFLSRDAVPGHLSDTRDHQRSASIARRIRTGETG